MQNKLNDWNIYRTIPNDNSTSGHLKEERKNSEKIQDPWCLESA